MVLVVTFVGSLIHIYSTGYMADEPRYAAYFGYLNLFTGAMLILVLGDNLPVMFIGWEGVGLCSYLLIGFWFTNESYAYAGRKAFVVNRIGDFAFLLGIFLLFWATGTLSFQDFHSAGAASHFQHSFLGHQRLALFAGLFLFIGACGKSAQIPLYVWLPDAMAGPTPVSALIHAATMVTAGVYMVARMSYLYLNSTGAMAIVAGVGAVTALFAAIMAFAQTDVKKVLAYSTISQLGFMFVGVGVGAYTAGIFHLVTHAFFKAGLFLAAGSIMHAMSGSGDIFKMGGLRKKLKWTHGAFLVYCLAIAGIFPFAGFFSKDEILGEAWATSAAGWWPLYGKILWIILTVAAVGTAFYMFRLYFLVFSGECRADQETQEHIHESPWSMVVPLVVLAVFAALIGFIGVPELAFFHGKVPSILHQWLEPALPELAAVGGGAVHVVHETDLAVLTLMAGALGLGLFGILGAWALYRRGPSEIVGRFTAGAGAGVYQVVKNKFYVDELYDRIVVRPFRWLALGLFEIIDRFLIDWVIVEGSAFVADLVGRLVRWFQNGQVQRYLVALVVGGALVFLIASRPHADFDWEQVGDLTVAFEADVGQGPGSNGAVVTFDFDQDGAPDYTATWKSGEPAPVTDWAFTTAGRHVVSMRLTDAVFKHTVEVTKTVTVEAPPSAAAVGQPAGATAPAGEAGARTPTASGGEP